MAQIRIYHDENDSTQSVTVNLNQGLLADGGGLGDSTAIEYYLTISTTIRKVDGSQFDTYIIRDLTDVDPNSSPPAANFQELIENYITYFQTEAQLAQSSSSSSTSSSSSSSLGKSSSSSSSVQYSSSSSESSSSTSSSSSIDSNSSSSS